MNKTASIQSVLNVVADSARTPTLSFSHFDLLADQIGGHLINSDSFLTSVTQRLMTEELINQISRAVASKASDPFDSIYISDLKPDIISATAIEAIERVDGIVDVSSTISFADDLD